MRRRTELIFQLVTVSFTGISDQGSGQILCVEINTHQPKTSQQIIA
jgi:hypothetical protein